MKKDNTNKMFKILTKDDFVKHNNKKHKSLMDKDSLVGATNYIQNQIPKDSKATPVKAKP